MKKISAVLDYIVASFFVFLVMLAGTSNLLSGVFPLLISIVCVLLFSAVFFKIRGDVFLQKAKKSENLKKQRLIETSLLYQTQAECFAFFSNFFKLVFSLDFKEENGYLKSEETFVYPCFECVEIGFPHLLQASKLARGENCKHLIVLCVKNSADSDFLLSMFETVSVFTSQNLYDKMIEHNFFPDMLDEKILPKKTFKSTFSVFLNRKKARGFGILGLTLFFFALISPFSTYYYIASSALLLFSAFLLLFKKH